ncbi:MAG: efflux RND transporter periplasmic adaptor subunit [Polyangiaceae bacterium]
MTHEPRLAETRRADGADSGARGAPEQHPALKGQRPDGAAIVALAKARRRRGRIYKVLIGALVVLGVGAYVVTRLGESGAPSYHFVTQPIKRGDLRETVTATGTLKGRDSVDVSSQISGRVSRVLVDVNDEVKEGDVLAEIDPTQLESRVEQSRAQVRAADASVQQARATAGQSEAERARIADLASKGLSSKQQLEAAEGDAARAVATLASAQAQATLSRANLKDAETSLSWARIRAPMDGIVLARLVEPGQSVAASLQAPVLFTVARDLAQLELRVEIDEADVGRVAKEQPASFTVDAWPDQVFPSKVLNVYNLPTTGTTVVTYQAVLAVDNSTLRLRPGMTATASVITSEKHDVLLAPNAALRFTPPALPQKSAAPALPFMGSMRPPGWNQRGRAPDKPGAPNQENLWVLQNEVLTPVLVEIGGTDGEFTEIMGAVQRKPGAGRRAAGAGASPAGERGGAVARTSAPAAPGSPAATSGAPQAAPGAARSEGAQGEQHEGEAPAPPPKIETGVPVVIDAEQQGKRPG